MTGKTFNEFLNELYFNPEMEFVYNGERYMLSGYMDGDDYVLELCSIGTNTILFTVSSASRSGCVSAFEKATLFDGRTIYEAEKEIEVLFG